MSESRREHGAVSNLTCKNQTVCPGFILEKLVVYPFGNVSFGGGHCGNVSAAAAAIAHCLQRPNRVVDGPVVCDLSRPATPRDFAEVAGGGSFHASSRHLFYLSQRSLAQFA